jgi:hypothetical protein
MDSQLTQSATNAGQAAAMTGFQKQQLESNAPKIIT